MRNETEDDLRQERLVADTLSHIWACTLKKITEDRLFLADFAAVHNGRVAAFVEIRCRSCSMDSFPTVFLPLQKAIWGQSVYTTTGVPYFYVVRFDEDDVIAYKMISGFDMVPKRVTWVTRRTEPETHPDGPVIEIPTNLFKIVGRETL
jgi:hypothetical protein